MIMLFVAFIARCTQKLVLLVAMCTYFYASTPVTAVAGRMTFSGCLSVCSILFKMIALERIDGISSN